MGPIMTVFDYIKIISEHLPLPEFDEEFQKVYSPWVTNTFFSFFPDTAYVANLINTQASGISSENHFRFLWSVVSKKKRSSKWFKAIKDDDVEFLQEIYDVNSSRASVFKSLLSEEEMIKLRASMFVGGTEKTKTSKKVK